MPYLSTSFTVCFVNVDGHVTPRVTLCSRRHFATWSQASPEERLDLLEVADRVRSDLASRFDVSTWALRLEMTDVGGAGHYEITMIPAERPTSPPSRRGPLTERTTRLVTGGDDDPFSRHILPLIDRAERVAILAAFVQDSGLRQLHPHLVGALRRGARVSVLTGDYLEITQAGALARLLDMARLWNVSTGEEDGGALGDIELSAPNGLIETRVVPVALRHFGATSFHPKSWRFEGDDFATAFVGSSNLSFTALGSGLEWNLRVDRNEDPNAYGEIVRAYDRLWAVATPLTEEWLADYARRARERPNPLPTGDAEPDVAAPPEPHSVQLEALQALATARLEGRRRAVVVLATGLGKTWLSAFDFAAVEKELGRRPRLLFVAHRRELLHQAAGTFRRLLGPFARVGWFLEDKGELSADLVFASTAKLSRETALQRLAGERFDYVVIDEVHHAAAASYRRILNVLDAGFVLGLTATPDRADSADILGLFDDNLSYRAGIKRGIDEQKLVPFHYFGVKDDIDYANIPWRNRHFDAEALSAAAQTEARMETLWRALCQWPGKRSLIFACSVAHALYVRDWLRRRELRVSCVFSAIGSDDRDGSLRALAHGALDAVVSVDILNEGVDLPSVDRVVMLRPTESSVVFLQQLGRGLRSSLGKSGVTVIDFVGNHRVFVERLRTVMSAASDESQSLHQLLQSAGIWSLPGGCSVELELEAKDLLATLTRVTGADEVETRYLELAMARGATDDPSQRPTPGELFRLGYLPSRVRERHGGWFTWVALQGHLRDDERRALSAAEAFLRELETTSMTKCYKMVTLQALVEDGALLSGLTVERLVARSFEIVRRSPAFLQDLPEELRGPTAGPVAERKQLQYWLKNPIAAWTGQNTSNRAWFRVDGDHFRSLINVEQADETALAGMVWELIDYRLAEYRRNKERGAAESVSEFVCKITWNRRDPIIKLPDRARGALPDGEVEVRLPDHKTWVFRFSKEYCNVAWPAGAEPRNRLGELLRRWFGPSAGRPGTQFFVRFQVHPGGLSIVPHRSARVQRGGWRPVQGYTELRAAAGAAAGRVDTAEGDEVWLPLSSQGPGAFAVRVSGSSMDGGKSPLKDGDWAVFRPARDLALSSLERRVVLLERTHAGSVSHHIKRLVRSDGESNHRFVSDNPVGPSFDASETAVPVAVLEESLRPEDVGPERGAALTPAELGEHFGLTEPVVETGRHHGHLLVIIEASGALIASDRLHYAVDARPAETAFVFERRDDDRLTCLGVARQVIGTSEWLIPEVDFQTWRRLGGSRSASRRTPPGLEGRAEELAGRALELIGVGGTVTRGSGVAAQIRRRTSQGGLVISLGNDETSTRSISLTDLAWVLAAADDASVNGGEVDEVRVNGLRYLLGTPEESTRFIDTGWAIAIWREVVQRST